MFGDVPMRVAGGLQVAKEARTLRFTQVGVVMQELFRFLGPGLKGTAQVQQVPLSLAHQVDKDFALAPALAAKPPHHLLQSLMQLMGLRAQGRGGLGALLADVLDEVKGFF